MSDANKPIFWASLNDERFTPFDTISAVLNEYGSYDRVYVGRGYQTDICLAEEFDAAEWLEQLSEGALEERLDPDDGVECLDLSSDHIQDLETAVRAAITAWQAALPHKLTSWSIEWTVPPILLDFTALDAEQKFTEIAQ
jgi:hypothetical protein